MQPTRVAHPFPTGPQAARESLGPEERFPIRQPGQQRRLPAPTAESRFGVLPSSPGVKAPRTGGFVDELDATGYPPGAGLFYTTARKSGLNDLEARRRDPESQPLPARFHGMWEMLSVERQTMFSPGPRTRNHLPPYELRPYDQALTPQPSMTQGQMSRGQVMRVSPWRPDARSLQPYAPVRPVRRRTPWSYGAQVPQD